jgi:hypothetical protein
MAVTFDGLYPGGNGRHIRNGSGHPLAPHPPYFYLNFWHMYFITNVIPATFLSQQRCLSFHLQQKSRVYDYINNYLYQQYTRIFICNRSTILKLHSLSWRCWPMNGHFKLLLLRNRMQAYLQVSTLITFNIFQVSTTVAARSKTWTVFVRSNIGIVGSNATQGMDVCVSLLCVYDVLSKAAALRRADPLSKEFYRSCIKLRNWKSSQGPKGCTAIEKYREKIGKNISSMISTNNTAYMFNYSVALKSLPGSILKLDLQAGIFRNLMYRR